VTTTGRRSRAPPDGLHPCAGTPTRAKPQRSHDVRVGPALHEKALEHGQRDGQNGPGAASIVVTVRAHAHPHFARSPSHRADGRLEPDLAAIGIIDPPAGQRAVALGDPLDLVAVLVGGRLVLGQRPRAQQREIGGVEPLEIARRPLELARLRR
jgi:hypothetical protein